LRAGDTQRWTPTWFRPATDEVISRAAQTAKGFKPGETFDVAFEGKNILLKKSRDSQRQDRELDPK